MLEFKLGIRMSDMPVIKLGQRHESELRCQYVSLKYEPVLLSGSLPESGKLLQVLADKIADGLDSRRALVGSPAAPWEPTNRIKAVGDYLSFDFLEFRAPKLGDWRDCRRGAWIPGTGGVVNPPGLSSRNATRKRRLTLPSAARYGVLSKRANRTLD